MIRFTLSATQALHHEQASTFATKHKYMERHIICTTSAQLLFPTTSTLANGTTGSLIDSGANGGLIGDDALVLEPHINSSVDITGIADLAVQSLPLVTAAAYISKKIVIWLERACNKV